MTIDGVDGCCAVSGSSSSGGNAASARTESPRASDLAQLVIQPRHTSTPALPASPPAPPSATLALAHRPSAPTPAQSQRGLSRPTVAPSPAGSPARLRSDAAAVSGRCPTTLDHHRLLLVRATL